MTPAHASARPSTVLVVDDDVDLQRVMTRLLTLERFVPVVAGNGQEALTYLRSGAVVDAILLDLRMPVMDGWAFRREQRADSGIAGVPVVVLSGTEPDRLAELDVAAAFRKPVSFPEVVAVLRRLCAPGKKGDGSLFP